LTCQCDTDDYYTPIDLNNIFNDDNILDEWIREGEQPILPLDDLGWLDEGIRHSNESGGDDDDDSGDDGGDGNDGGDDDDSGDGGYGGNDERTCGVGENQRDGVMSWDSDYYTTRYKSWRLIRDFATARHLDRLVD